MFDSFHIDQYDALCRLEEWHTFRTSQNVFIDYRSWSDIYQTLSMYLHQSDIKLNEVLFLTPVQIHAVELTRSGVWAESIREYIYESYSPEKTWVDRFGGLSGYNNIHKLREAVLFRSEKQPYPKLIVILDAQLITKKMLKDTNEYLKRQTIVCYDSARYCPDNSIVYLIDDPINHTFLNDDSTDMQKFLFQMLQKQMVPLSTMPSVRVHEYTKAGYDLRQLAKPLLSATPDYQPTRSPKDSRIVKGDLVYTANYNWRYSLESSKYYLTKGIYLIIRSISKRDGITYVTSRPTYSNFQFKRVVNVNYCKVVPAHLIDQMPQWSFLRGGIIVPKIIKTVEDAKRIYNAVNMFQEQVDLYIV